MVEMQVCKKIKESQKNVIAAATRGEKLPASPDLRGLPVCRSFPTRALASAS
jgi:hypothetical protein